MAIDTRSKRASSVRFGMPWMIAIVLPDGNINEQVDRQHQAWVYSGILAGLLTLLTRKHHIRLCTKTVTFRR